MHSPSILIFGKPNPYVLDVRVVFCDSLRYVCGSVPPLTHNICMLRVHVNFPRLELQDNIWQATKTD